MNIDQHFESLSGEIKSLKNRVRNLIADRHWLTDGEWKESVVRQVLRRNLPTSVEVGRGFVITGSQATHQLDVLIHDTSKPVLFRDGDLVFVTPDAVLGIVEVKSRLTPSLFESTLGKLCSDIDLIRRHPNIRAFAAVFAFEVDGSDSEALLDVVARVADTWTKRLDFASMGESKFIRYWPENPENPKQVYESWHSYKLPGRAPGYFVHNAVDSICPESVFSNAEVWFPSEGKEPYRDGRKKSAWADRAS